MYTSMDILIQLADIKKGGSPDSNLNFYDQVVRVGKGWVEHEFVLFIICRIATWNKVAKWVTILQDKMSHTQVKLYREKSFKRCCLDQKPFVKVWMKRQQFVTTYSRVRFINIFTTVS